MIRKVDINSPLKQNCIELFNKSVEKREVLFKGISSEMLEDIIFGKLEGVEKICLADSEGKAFAAGSYDSNLKKNFITLIITEEKSRRQSLATELLKELEKELYKLSGLETMEISFFNPTPFLWEVPDKEGVMHPCAPGVLIGSPAWLFFENTGYRCFATQNSYLLQFNNYEIPEKIKEKEDRLNKNNITIEIFDKDKHEGLMPFLEKLQNPIWVRDISGEPSIHKGGRPILAAICNNKIVGFTGPMEVEKNGRGFFAGIGVDPDFRGKGIAPVLFSHLSYNLQEMGAEYMTLYTGENNVARDIYEKTGFKVVATFGDLRKNLNVKA